LPFPKTASVKKITSSSHLVFFVVSWGWGGVGGVGGLSGSVGWRVFGGGGFVGRWGGFCWPGSLVGGVFGGVWWLGFVVGGGVFGGWGVGHFLPDYFSAGPSFLFCEVSSLSLSLHWPLLGRAFSFFLPLILRPCSPKPFLVISPPKC